VGGALTTGTSQYAIITDPQLAGTDNYALFANARIKASTAVTNTFGVYIPTAEKLSGATIVNNYALYIANQTSGSSTNYSIYSSGGLNYFGGATTIGAKLTANATNGAIQIGGSGYTLNPSGMMIGQYVSSMGYIQAPSGGRVEIWNGATENVATFFNDKSATFYGSATVQGSLQVNTNGFSLKGWRQYAVQISAGGSTNTGAIIFRQFQDSVNWNTGGVVVEIINYSYAHSEYDTRKEFARYGYSGNAATINTINGSITGKIPQPYWGSAVQGSGVYYYRDLMIDIQPYHAYVISLTTPMSLNGSSTVGNGTIYLFS
jgi:hypothetical protein